jgi:hypothetical protein
MGADTGVGTELSEAVSAVLPEVVAAVMAELSQRRSPGKPTELPGSMTCAVSRHGNALPGPARWRDLGPVTTCQTALTE